MTSLASLVDGFRQRHGIPAVGAAIVTPAGVGDLAVAGVARRGSPAAAQAGDSWHLGSCGKSMTAALYARLVESGAAAWATPVGALFPDLEQAAGWDAVTIDDLLVHRAGVPANLQWRELDAAARDRRPLREQRTEAAARVLARPPRRAGHFRYSNLGYTVAGAAIERLAGEPYEATLRRLVLEPLGMVEVGFGAPARLWGHGGRVAPFVRLGIVAGRGRAVAPDELLADNPPVMAPAGTLHATLESWSRFQRVFLDGGAGFLAPASISKLVTPVDGPGRSQAMGWAPPGPSLGSAAMGQQGSNALWNAAALVDSGRRRSVLVVCNDGRSSVGMRSARLAARALAEVGAGTAR